jgi:hypothetical protein
MAEKIRSLTPHTFIDETDQKIRRRFESISIWRSAFVATKVTRESRLSENSLGGKLEKM